MFLDLNLGESTDEPSLTRQKLELAKRLGYDCVVVHNEIIQAVSSDTVKHPANSGQNAIETVLQRHSILHNHSQPIQNPLQVSRLTLVSSTSDNAYALNNPNVRRNFDLIAAQPLNEEAFAEACANLDVDIIAFDLAKPLSYKLTVKRLQNAVKRGIHFEIIYRPAVKGQDQNRTLFFASVQMICKALRGRNIILSSGASQALDMRGPYDIVNFGTLFGLNESQTKEAVSRRPEAVLRHALSQQATSGVQISRMPITEKQVPVKTERPKKLEDAQPRPLKRVKRDQKEDVIDIASSEEIVNGQGGEELESNQEMAQILPQFLRK